MATAFLNEATYEGDDDNYSDDDDYSSSSSSSSTYGSILSETLDYSYRDLTKLPDEILQTNSDNKNRIMNKVKSLQLNCNLLMTLPLEIERFQMLLTLEISNNQIVQLPREISTLKNLRYLLAKNNCLDDLSLPKELEDLKQLEIINLGGNRLKQFPYQLFQLFNLKEIYLGSNQISLLPDLFQTLNKVEVLYLGGNQITNAPDSIGLMQNLIVLNLSGNHLRTLPSSISRLPRLKSLSLHNNQFSALPPDIIRLNLQELSLRNNPLVVRFVRDLTYDVPCLKELAARTVRNYKLSYNNKAILPQNLIDYLNSAKCCVNPKCKGVYFESYHKNIKFVDFCGKFYLPLLQFLCSPACTTSPSFQASSTSSESEDHEQDQVFVDNNVQREMNSKFKKVLLG